MEGIFPSSTSGFSIHACNFLCFMMLQIDKVLQVLLPKGTGIRFVLAFNFIGPNVVLALVDVVATTLGIILLFLLLSFLPLTFLPEGPTILNFCLPF